MTGTAFTEAKEFEEVYKLKTVALTAIRKWIFEPPWLVVFEKKKWGAQIFWVGIEIPGVLGDFWPSLDVNEPKIPGQ